MKKLTLMAILLSLALVACGEKKVEEVKEAATQTVEQAKEATTEAVAEVKDAAAQAVEEVKDAVTDALKFKAADGVEYTLDIKGEDAVLKSSTGEEYALKADVAASGTRFADDKGNEIHFKEGSGVVNLNGKEVNIELVK